MVGRKYRLGNLETPWEWGLGKDNEGGKWTDEERQLQGEAEQRRVYFIFLKIRQTCLKANEIVPQKKVKYMREKIQKVPEKAGVENPKQRRKAECFLEVVPMIATIFSMKGEVDQREGD